MKILRLFVLCFFVAQVSFSGIKFDGVADTAIVDDADNLTFGDDANDDDPLSIAAWVWIITDPFDIVMKIAGFGGADAAEWNFNVGGSGHFQLHLFDATYGNRLEANGDPILAHYGKWIHLGVAYPGDEVVTNIKHYLMGNLWNSGLIVGAGSYSAMHNTGVDVNIGCLTGAPRTANGYIAEVTIWREYRTQAQFRAHMNKKIGQYTNLEGYWRFDEGYVNSAPGGTDFLDFSGKGNHGNLSGGFYTGHPPIRPYIGGGVR